MFFVNGSVSSCTFSLLATLFDHWTCTGQPSAHGPCTPMRVAVYLHRVSLECWQPFGFGEEKKGMCTCGLRSCCAAKGAGAPTQLRAPLLTVLMLMGTRRAPGSLSENPDLRTNCCTVALLMKLSGCFRAARVRCYVCYLQSQVTGRISCPAPVVDLHAEITQQSATNCKICHLQQCLQHCF